MPLYNVADRQDRIAQTSVVNATVLGVDLGRLGEDQPLLFKTLNVFLHAVFASADGFTDRRVTGMTLEGFSVLATHQKRVHQDLAVGEPETEDLIRHGKEVLHFPILQIHLFTSRRKLKRKERHNKCEDDGDYSFHICNFFPIFVIRFSYSLFR